jgi:hypothetical protein
MQVSHSVITSSTMKVLAGNVILDPHPSYDILCKGRVIDFRYHRNESSTATPFTDILSISMCSSSPVTLSSTISQIIPPSEVGPPGVSWHGKERFKRAQRIHFVVKPFNREQGISVAEAEAVYAPGFDFPSLVDRDSMLNYGSSLIA